MRKGEKGGKRGNDNEVKTIVIKPIPKIDTGLVALPTNMRQSVIWILNVPSGNCMMSCLGSFRFSFS